MQYRRPPMRRALAKLLVVGTAACQSHAPAPSASASVQPSSVSSAAHGSCIDSDEHAPDPRRVKGSVTVSDGTAKTTTIPDACQAEHYVREGRCPEEPTEVDAQLGYYFLAYCPDGCRDGACLP
jgi:hypothetical protein